MDTNWIEKYAKLLVHYSLYLKEDERVFIRSTTLAQPLISAIHKEALKVGAILDYDLSFEFQEEHLMYHGTEKQLDYINPLLLKQMEQCDAYLLIRAPFDGTYTEEIPEENKIRRNKAWTSFNQTYFKRLGDGSLKRSLCQYPTSHAAKLAGMNLEEYTMFVRDACFLNEDRPEDSWKTLSSMQQRIVDYLNKCRKLVYRGPEFEISFSVEGRTWINSDGKSNMPSGEVFTSPVEDSVNGEIYFNYPSVYMNAEVEGVRLIVKDGEIQSWTAKKGQEFLDKIFLIEGTRFFGEAAIATNQNIQRPTRNILFDEKIGGTIHMAIGQSYYQAGGKNQSTVHWDLITDMKNGGEIIADGELIYRNGEFLMNKLI